MVGISGKIMNGDENIEKCLKLKIDFAAAHTKLENVRADSYAYLVNSLNNA